MLLTLEEESRRRQQQRRESLDESLNESLNESLDEPSLAVQYHPNMEHADFLVNKPLLVRGWQRVELRAMKRTGTLQ